jgi:hypothetical protein
MPRPFFAAVIALAAGAIFAAPASAEVVARTPDGFTLREEAFVVATPQLIASALGEVDQWWNGEHTYSGSAANLSLPLGVGACLCEAMADGSTFEHGRLTALDPATGLTLEAPLGPLKTRASRAALNFTWSPEGEGLKLVMTYEVEGAGLGAFAAPVDGVMTDQFARLVRHLERPVP